MFTHTHADQFGQGLRDYDAQPTHFAIPDAQTVATRWQQSASAGATRYAEGVQNTDKDPTALAVQAGPRYFSGVQEAFNSGKWARGLQRVGKAGWQRAVADKGVTNYSTGVNAARDKVASAFAPLLAFESNLQGQINAMPNVTDGDRENRMLAWTRGMRQYQRPS